MSVVSSTKVSTLALALVTVLALSATAATIDSTVGGPAGQAGWTPDLGGGDGGTPDLPDGGTNGPGDAPGVDHGQRLDLAFCVEFLQRPAVILGIVGALALVFYGVSRRWTPSAAVLSATGVLPVVLAGYFLLTNCATAWGGVAGDGGGVSNPVPNGGGGLSAPAVPPVALAAVLLGVVGVAAVVLYSVTGEAATFEDLDEEPEDDPEEVDFAEAAGRAADRIENHAVPVDNAVYRAWLEMTNLLDIPNPESCTPMDFAEAAIAFGLDEDDVMELTDLFNEVRYGHMDAESREERAVAILRAIEAAYGTDGDGGGS